METVEKKTPSGQKAELIKMLADTGALKTAGDFSLKSKRESPYFLNIGDVNVGSATAALAKAYAGTIAAAAKEKGWKNIDIYGIPEKGVSLAPVVASMLALDYGIAAGWFFTRKMEKTYGEATNLPKAELAKGRIVGRIPTAESEIIVIDDVLATAKTKYDAIEELNDLLEKPNIVALVIGADRQEVGIDGKNATNEFSESTGIPVFAALDATEIRRQLSASDDAASKRGAERMAAYLRVYGTKTARFGLTVDGLEVDSRIVAAEKSVIPACDMEDIGAFEKLAAGTAKVEGVGALKIGFALTITYGLKQVVDTARKHTTIPIIYDHQKGATDVPDTGSAFVRAVKRSGADAIILFPQSGPETERAWIYRALDSGLKVIVGGIMTHPAYLVSEGGFIQDSAAFEMYRIAARAGARNFVVPGTKPDIIKQVKEAVKEEGVENPIWYVPGMVTQGGAFAQVKEALGANWNAIVGRAITNAKDGNYTAAAEEQVRQLLRA